MRSSVLVGIVIILTATGCVGSNYISPTASVPTHASDQCCVDGIAFARVFTWNDVNADGKYEEGEPILPYVTTSVGYPDFISGSDGWAEPWEFIPGCAENCWHGWSVTVKVPPGYIPTTPTNYSLTGDDVDYYFGFRLNNDDQIITFPNEPEWQMAFINRGNKVLAFHFSDRILQITIDRDGSISDDYYPESILTEDEFYFGLFIFDVILELVNHQNVDIVQTQITFTPSNTIFECNTSSIDRWVGRISGYEILTQHCGH